MLSPEILADLLPSKVLNQSLFVFDELPSTNTFALELARNPTPQGTVILADKQTAGRGRLQRTWFSPPKTNIYGSLIFSVNEPFLSLGWIPLIAGAAIAQAIEETTKIHITLKWPNDILIQEQKVGGILCESFKRNSTETCVVIGFGININLSLSALPKNLQQHVTSLHLHTQHLLDRHHLLKPIIQKIEQAWDTLTSQGPQACQQAYQSRCDTIGMHIQVQLPDGKTIEGMAHSIGKQGQLQISPSPSDAMSESARIMDIHAGDIHHIRKSNNL